MKRTFVLSIRTLLPMSIRERRLTIVAHRGWALALQRRQENLTCRSRPVV
jgi:hypothetical protein